MYEFSIGQHLGVPPGTYLKSIQVDGREIQNWTVDLSRGAPTLTAIYASDVGSLDGFVTDAQGRTVPVFVYFVREGGAPSYRFAPRPVRADGAGRFTVAAVIPGDYRVFAFPLPADRRQSDPEFRSQFLDQSTVVHVEPGIAKTVDLKVISKN